MRERARALFERASAAFARAEYAVAGPAFHAAYELDPQPVLLLNAAQSFRLAQPPDCVAAERDYALFLQREPDSPFRDEVERNLAAMRGCVAAEARARVPARTPSATPRRLTFAGLGVMAAAGVTYGVVLARYHQLKAQCPCTDDVIDPWNTATRVSYGLALAGGAVAIVGALWWRMTLPRSNDGAVAAAQARLWVQPFGVAGLALGGRF